MKKSGLIFGLILASVFFSLLVVSAAACELEVSLLNQDPYPAIPGDYVKVVFQITGLENPECGLVKFGISEEYPISLDPNTTNQVTIEAGTFQRKYSSSYLAPYMIRIDKNAIEGNNPIEVSYSVGLTNYLEEFNIYVEDSRADFEIYVKDYDYSTNELTFEILNIEDVDIQALTIEVPKQEGINVKGANKKVIGDLDSNEYTSADFEMVLPDGESEINVNLIYTDSINIRREINKTVHFDSDYFTDRSGTQKKTPWLWIILAVAVVGWIIYRRIKKKKKEAERKKKLMSGK